MGDVYITNTWEIAEWVSQSNLSKKGCCLAISTNSKQLDEKYGFNKTLFPSEGEKTHKETHKVFFNSGATKP